MTKKKERSVSPPASCTTTTGSSSTSSTSSSSSSTSSSSDSSSSSDTEHSSAVSTRASSSEPEPVSAVNKRGPKTSALSVPKPASSNSIKKNVPKPAIRTQNQASSHKSRHVPQKTSSSTPLKKSSSKKTSESRDKKLKKKSLFSPDHSSDSETDARQIKLKVNPKLPITPTKSKKKSTPPKGKSSTPSKHIKDTQNRRSTRKSSGKPPGKSSESSTNSSSGSSESDSDSSSDTSQSEKESSLKKNTRGSSETEKEEEEVEVDEEEELEEEDGEDGDSPRRLITRSSSVKTKRSSLLGINKGTDSDSDNGKSRRGSRHPESKKQLSRNYCSSREEALEVMSLEAMGGRISKSGAISKTKKPIQRVKNSMIEHIPLPPIEKRNCPVDGCDSSGHLGGFYERHFTVEACPIFHNLTKEDCKVNRDHREKEWLEREQASMNLNARSPRSSTKMEQRNYCNSIRDSRDCMSELRPGEEEMADSDRQPCLRSLTPDWDLQLFLQAQASSSEKVEDEMRGLYDTKGIRYIQMGHYEMEAWYQSQYPDDYNQQPKIYVCEFCLKYMRSKTILKRHTAKCVWRHPPGDEIYRKDKLSVWEVDGKKYKTYCQNLCLLAMLFLDHKTLYYDVEPFLFYIMTTTDSEGCHIIGYFSKEKNSFLNYNVSCIMTLPPYQRKGFGRLLIDFSYLLTKEEGKIGSPEKPLSDLGLISYRSYWKDLLLKYLVTFNQKNVCIKDISQEMAVNSYDIVSTFQAMGMMKYWKGKHILLKRQDLFEEFQERKRRRPAAHREIVPCGLNWRPYVPPPPSADSPNNNNNNNNNSNSSNNNVNTSNKLEKKSKGQVENDVPARS